MLSRRARGTLAAVARVLVPPGGSIPQGADDLGLVETLVAEVDSYPRRAVRRTRLLLFATEYLPLVSGKMRRFSKLSAGDQTDVLERNGRSPRSPLRRLIVSYLKQLVYSNYISQPAVEQAVGYDYTCATPREGTWGDRTHR